MGLFSRRPARADDEPQELDMCGYCLAPYRNGKPTCDCTHADDD
jgi:hypothetical protein